MKTVMIVDDSRVMRQLVRRSLRQAGYKIKNVFEAENGLDGLAQLAGGAKPELILTDWNMPEMNGIDFLRALNEKKISIPLGFVTSESTPDMRAMAIAEGAKFLLTKPFTAADVRHSMEAAGFKPDGSGRIGDAGRVIIGSQKFGPGLVTELLTPLVNQPIMIREGAVFATSVVPAMTCTWVNDSDELLYAGLCELSLAAALGGAIGLRPASAVPGLIASGEIPDELRPDSREVFNVLSRSFTDAGSVHVRLLEISFAPDPPLQSVLDLNGNAAARQDYKVSVGSHGSGRLAIVSTSPGFIHFS